MRRSDVYESRAREFTAACHDADARVVSISGKWTRKQHADFTNISRPMTHLSRGLKLSLIFVAAGWACVDSTIAKVDPFKTAINDPIFGHYYYPNQASFERIRFSSLGAACLNYERDFYPTSKHPPAYLYGLYEHEITHIWIIGTNDGATLFVRRGDSCVRTNPVIAFWQNYSPASRNPAEPEMSRSEIINVFSDLLVRFEKAFRGKEHFLNWLDDYTEAVQRTCSDPSRQTCPPTWHSLPSYLQDILTDFRIRSPDK